MTNNISFLSGQLAKIIFLIFFIQLGVNESQWKYAWKVKFAYMTIIASSRWEIKGIQFSRESLCSVEVIPEEEFG